MKTAHYTYTHLYHIVCYGFYTHNNILAKNAVDIHTHFLFPTTANGFVFVFQLRVLFFFPPPFAIKFSIHDIYSTTARFVCGVGSSSLLLLLLFSFVSHIYNTDFVISLPLRFQSLFRYVALFWLQFYNVNNFKQNDLLRRPLILSITCFY